MANTYSWNVLNLSVVQNPDPNYVVSAVWSLTGTDGTFTNVYNSASDFVVQENDPNFIPFNELTPDIIIGWIQAGLGQARIAEIEAEIDYAIDIKIYQSTVVKPNNVPVPWQAGA
jgi:hypothetical protein